MVLRRVCNGLPWRVLVLALLALVLAACSTPFLSRGRTMSVTATAYTLAASETGSGPRGLTAWGDQLRPGMKAIAVSHDLIGRGLTHGTAVKIHGLPGKYIVRDRMPRRWRKRIDIYMPKRADALQWGRREVTISW